MSNIQEKLRLKDENLIAGKSPLVKLIESGEIANLFSILTGVNVPIVMDPNTDGAHLELSLDESFLKVVRFVFGTKNPESGFLSRRESLYLASHELMHLYQFISDPENMNKLRQSLDEQVHSNNDTYMHLANRFLNAILDISANANIPYKIKLFSKLRQSTSSLQQIVIDDCERNFPENDLTKYSSYSNQFTDYLVISITDPSRKVVVSEKVWQEISKPVRYMGKDYNDILDFCRSIIFKPLDVLSMRKLNFIFRQVLLPIFNKLYLLDKTLLTFESNTSCQDAQGNDDIDRDIGEIEEIWNVLAEMNLEPIVEVRKRRARAQKITQMLYKKNQCPINITKEIVQRDRRSLEIARKIAKYWKLLATKTKHRQSALVLSESGSTINIPALIDAFARNGGDLVSGVEIFDEDVVVESSTQSPVSINITVAIDASGSMFGNPKYKTVKDMAYTLALSLHFFMKSEENVGKADIHNINFSALNFGDDAAEFSSLTINANDETLASIVHDFSLTTMRYADNNGDHKALELATATMLKHRAATNGVKKPMKTIDLCFYITDGGTAVVDELREAARNYTDNRGILIPIQINQDLTQMERSLFIKVFGDSGQEAYELTDIQRIVIQSIAKVVNQ